MLFTNFLLPAMGLLAISVHSMPTTDMSEPRAAAWGSMGIDGICTDADMAIEAFTKAKTYINKIFEHANKTHEPAVVTAHKITLKIHEMTDAFDMTHNTIKNEIDHAEKRIGYKEANTMMCTADKILHISRNSKSHKEPPCDRVKVILKLVKRECERAMASLREVITVMQCFANDSEEMDDAPGALDKARQVADGAGYEMDDRLQKALVMALLW